jgi:hypothetical protein
MRFVIDLGGLHLSSADADILRATKGEREQIAETTRTVPMTI